MMISGAFVAFVGSLFLVVGSSHFFVKSAMGLASFLRLPPHVVGLVFLALGTSLPEMMISLNAAWQGDVGVSIGNVVGSNIANVLLIVGGATFFLPYARIMYRGSLGRENHLLMMLTFVFGSLLSWLVLPPLWGGGVLLLGGGLFLWHTFVSKSLGEAPREAPREASQPKHDVTFWLKNSATVGVFVLSMLVLQISAVLVLKSAGVIAQWLDWSPLIVGVVLLAFGTSLPEMAVSLSAIWQGQTALFWGNIVGSNIINLTFVGGFAMMFFPDTLSYMPILSWRMVSWLGLCGLAFWFLIAFPKMRLMHFLCRLLLPSYVVFLVWLAW